VRGSVAPEPITADVTSKRRSRRRVRRSVAVIRLRDRSVGRCIRRPRRVATCIRSKRRAFSLSGAREAILGANERLDCEPDLRPRTRRDQRIELLVVGGFDHENHVLRASDSAAPGEVKPLELREPGVSGRRVLARADPATDKEDWPRAGLALGDPARKT